MEEKNEVKKQETKENEKNDIIVTIIFTALAFFVALSFIAFMKR